MEKEFIKLFENYIDYIQSMIEYDTNQDVAKETDMYIHKLYKLKLKYENSLCKS